MLKHTQNDQLNPNGSYNEPNNNGSSELEKSYDVKLLALKKQVKKDTSTQL